MSLLRFTQLFLTRARRGTKDTNIKLIMKELEKKEMVDISHILKVFLLFVLAEHRGKKAFEVREERDTIFNDMLADAVTFCNDSANPILSEYMRSLEE